ncbi:MFS transporter [Candidatus Azambacteria bacterium]|nr:MFS transporter [Candidatus Azambacteria bacterium]
MDENKKTVWLFSIGAFLNDFGHYFVFTIWPIFVTSVIGASAMFLGFVDGLGDAFASLSQAASGLLSDKIKKRKIFIWLGYFFAFFSRIIYSFSTRSWQLIPGKILDRSGKMRDAPRDAIVADITPREKRASAFGALRAADRGGAVLGLAASLFLAGYFAYRELFLIAAIPSLAGSLIILFFVKEKITSDGLAPKFSFKFASRDFKVFTALSAIFTLGAFSDSFYILAANKLGVSLKLLPLFYLTYMLFSSLMAIPFGKMADKIGRRPVIGFAFILFMATNAMFIFFNSLWMILLAFAVYGLHGAAYEGNIKTIVAEFAPYNMRASIIGGFQMLIGLIALPASFIAGILWDAVNFRAPFALSLILTAIAFAALFFVREPKTEK